MMRSCLITGATGLVGRHLSASLAGKYELHAPARAALDFERPWDPSILPEKIDAVVHLAQSDRYRDFPAGAQSIFDVNVKSTALLLDWAARAGAKHFVFASTGGLYRASPRPVTEESELSTGGPLAYYLAGKRSAELLVEAYAERGLFSTAVLRFFFIYGPGQKDSMLFPRLTRAVTRGEPVTLQGPDGLSFNPLHAEDAAEAIAAALELEGRQLINVAGPEVLTLRRAVELIGGALGVPPRFQIDAEKEPATLIADIARMRERLIAPKVTPALGLAELRA